MVLITLLDQQAAVGQVREVEDYPEKHTCQVPYSFTALYHPNKLLAIFVSGDNMINEKINDGNIVIFHPKLKEGNTIYVVFIGNSLVVKRVDFNGINQAFYQCKLRASSPAFLRPGFGDHTNSRTGDCHYSPGMIKL
jgi:SOS-response transcriptional repressor LexA